MRAASKAEQLILWGASLIIVVVYGYLFLHGALRRLIADDRVVFTAVTTQWCTEDQATGTALILQDYRRRGLFITKGEIERIVQQGFVERWPTPPCLAYRFSEYWCDPNVRNPYQVAALEYKLRPVWVYRLIKQSRDAGTPLSECFPRP